MKRFFGVVLIALMVLIYVASLHAHSDNGSTANSVTQNKPASLPPPNPAQTAKCKKLLDYGSSIGAWESYDVTADGHGEVVVGPSFNSASFKNKQILDAAFRCVMSRGRENYEGVQYVGYMDPYTNKEIAKWSVYTGFSVD